MISSSRGRGKVVLAIVLLVGACSGRPRDQAADTVGTGARAPTPDTVAGPADTVRVPDQPPEPGPAAANAFRAAGNEPFWALDIDSTGLHFRTPEDPKGTWFSSVAPTRVADTLQWVGKFEDATIDARIWPGQCSDGMSDRVWTHNSLVITGGTTYKGCAEFKPAGSSD